MIVVCTHCSMRLQLDDAKVPARAFTVRCPKCQNVINAQPPANEQSHSALANSYSPATEHPRLDRNPAPVFKQEINAEAEATAESVQADSSVASANDLLRLLATLVQRGATGGEKQVESKRLAWERHRVLVCIEPEHRQKVARKLAEHEYHVFVAENATQAIERMREEHMDIIILDPSFEPVEQGAAHVSNEINAMRPAERRRTFLVHFSATGRTLDQHAAFVSNVNLLVNHGDIEQMPRALERSLRDYNELYRDLNRALNVAPL
ncbi:MAG TPA: zinc-ribbon domain-containing protein [Pyrinomonadaceae bacterium]|nr:zinc-ribbon domain-containing protein [Pyrinomonadaceae bacterium]